MVTESDWQNISVDLSSTNSTPESWLQLKQNTIFTYSLNAVDSSGNIVPDYYYSSPGVLQSHFADSVLGDPTNFPLGQNYGNLSSSQQEVVRFLLNDPNDTSNSTLTNFDANDFTYRCSFSDVFSALTFSQISATSSNAGDITFIRGDVQGDAGLTDIPRSGYYADDRFSGDVWIKSNNTDISSHLTQGGIGYFLILHELGHAMGLEDATAAYNDARGYKLALGSDLDNQKYTIMSFNSDTEVNPDTTENSNYVYASGLQMLDILAIQSIYGRDYSGDRGANGAHINTVYGYGHGFGDTVNTSFIYTIWDGAGADVIDASNYTAAQIDLRQGHFSSIGFQGDGSTAIKWDNANGDGVDHGNVGIALYAVIENAIGTDNGDVLVGNEWGNVLYGGIGVDTIYGDGIIFDGVSGFHNNDANRPGPNAAADLSGDDILIGGADNDLFYGGKGNDVIHGGYVASDITSIVSTWDSAGEFTGTNNIKGQALPEINYSSNSFADGTDTLWYSKLDEGIHVTFVANSVGATTVVKGTTGEYGTDKLFSIESIGGTTSNDIFDGTTDTASVSASLGTDQYTFSSTGPFGGLIYYNTFLDAVGVHIAVTVTGSGGHVDKSDSSGFLAQDTIGTGIKTLVGTAQDDSFSGFRPGAFVSYYGGGGSDSYSLDMSGFGFGGPTTATVNVFDPSNGALGRISVSNSTSQTLVSQQHSGSNLIVQTDYFNGSNVLHVYFEQDGQTAVQTASIGGVRNSFGTITADLILSGTGDQVIFGGGGSDTVDYSAATGGVTANLATGTATNNGWGYTDTYHDISNILGSGFADNITGDSNANVLNGGAGADTISAGGGNDTVIGGSGVDTMDGGSGTDTLDYSGSSNWVVVDLHNGTANADGVNETFTNFENVIGSSFGGDILVGDSGANVIDGGAGSDWVYYTVAPTASPSTLQRVPRRAGATTP